MLQAATTGELNAFVPKLMAQLGKVSAIRNPSTSFLDKGLSAYLAGGPRHRGALRRHRRHHRQCACMTVFGQRIISTIFTESTQRRVILEADPRLQNSVESMKDIYLPSAGGGQVPLAAIGQHRAAGGAAGDRPSRPVSLRHHLL